MTFPNVLKISELGLVEMTRKRTRENLVQQLCEPCRYCEGRGYVASAETVAYKVLREVRKDLPRFCGHRIALAVNPRVAEMLLGSLREAMTRLGDELGSEIEVQARPGLHQEQFEVTALDAGAPVSLSLRWLETPEAEKPEAQAPPPKAPAAEAPESAEAPEETAPDEPTVPTEEESSDPAWGFQEPPAAGTASATSQDTETLAAAALDAEAENPIIRPSEPPEES